MLRGFLGLAPQVVGTERRSARAMTFAAAASSGALSWTSQWLGWVSRSRGARSGVLEGFQTDLRSLARKRLEARSEKGEANSLFEPQRSFNDLRLKNTKRVWTKTKRFWGHESWIVAGGWRYPQPSGSIRSPRHVAPCKHHQYQPKPTPNQKPTCFWLLSAFEITVCVVSRWPKNWSHAFRNGQACSKPADYWGGSLTHRWDVLWMWGLGSGRLVLLIWLWLKK